MARANVNVHIRRIVVPSGTAPPTRSKADVAANIRQALQLRLADGASLRAIADRGKIAAAITDGLAPRPGAPRKGARS